MRRDNRRSDANAAAAFWLCVFPDVFQHPPSPPDETEILIAETIGSSLAGGQRAEGVAEGAPPAPASLALAKATDPARMRFHTIQKKGSSVVAFCEFRRGCRTLEGTLEARLSPSRHGASKQEVSEARRSCEDLGC